MNTLDRPELTQDLTESFCSPDPTIARRFAEVTFLSDNRNDLPRITVPTLVMQCSDDLIAPSSVGDYVSRHIPQSKLRLLAGSGHCPHMSHPEETVHVIKEYLAA